MAHHAPAVARTTLPRRNRKVKACPQLEIIETPLTSVGYDDAHTEFRVYNWRRLRSGRVIRGDSTTLFELILPGALMGYLYVRHPWRIWTERNWVEEWRWIGGALGLVLLVYGKSRTVLYESIEPLPGLGLQLSTIRGVSLPHPLRLESSKPHTRLLLPLSTSRRFIPVSTISTVIINERLTRWSVRYYLAVVLRKGEGIVVLLDNMRQDIEVMKEIYYGVREILFDDYDDAPPSLRDESRANGEPENAQGAAVRRRRSKKRRK